MDTARREILNKLQMSPATAPLTGSPDFNKPVYFPVEGNLIDVFKKNNELINGKTSVFDSEENLFLSLKQKIEADNLEIICCYEPAIQEKLTKFQIPFWAGTELPENIDAGITGCEFLVAHTGSAVVSSAQEGGRRIFAFPPVHIIIASEKQLADYLETAYKKIFEKYGQQIPSLITVITGPSRTADIEKTLVLGAHGPKELHIFISKN